MATVDSLTASRIIELLAGYEGIELTQDELNALIIQLKASVDGSAADILQFNEVTKPKLEQDVAASANAVSELTTNILPDLQAGLDEASLAVTDLTTVLIPSLREDINATMANVAERPNVYTQPDEPTNPDVNDRDLVVGDTWFDEDDNNKERVWNGVEWSTFGIDIPDFSITAEKFKTSTHILY